MIFDRYQHSVFFPVNLFVGERHQVLAVSSRDPFLVSGRAGSVNTRPPMIRLHKGIQKGGCLLEPLVGWVPALNSILGEHMYMSVDTI